MSGINLAILWTECFNKHNNLDILSFNRKNNSWLKIIFLKTLQFLYFRTRNKQFSIQGEPKNVWSNKQDIGSNLLNFGDQLIWPILMRFWDWIKLSMITFLLSIITFLSNLTRKKFCIFFCGTMLFSKKNPKHCKNTMHDNFIKKNFSEDKIFKTFFNLSCSILNKKV